MRLQDPVSPPLASAAEEAAGLGIPAICLFPYTDPALKSEACEEAWNPGNLTNRSPWPLLHIIREESLEQALEHYPEADQIPARNILRMEALSTEDKARLFPYLFG